MITMDVIRVRAKEGGHYSDWLYVPELIKIVEDLQLQYERLTIRVGECDCVITKLEHENQCLKQEVESLKRDREILLTGVY